MNSLTYFIENQQKNQIECGLRAKFRANYVQCYEKSKEKDNIVRSFHIFGGNYLLKQEAVVLKSPEWKFMAIIARNAKFQGC